MATINIAAPAAVLPAGTTGQVPMQSYTVSSHVNDGDFVVLSGGTIATSAANIASGYAGIACHDSNANYGGLAAVNPPTSAGLQNVFGYGGIGNLIIPPNEGQTLVALLDAPALVEINVSVVTGWISGGTYQANIGTRVGLAIDGTTGFFVADPNASNKVATIVEKIYGPSFGNTGDLASRVRIRMDAAALSA